MDPQDAVGDTYDSINDIPEEVINESSLATVQQLDGTWEVITQDHWEGTTD